MILPPNSPPLNTVITVVLFAVLALWQITCLLHPRLPSLGVLVNVFWAWRPTRWFLILGWIWWGWHMWVRGSW
jgi:hypothetical protein